MREIAVLGGAEMSLSTSVRTITKPPDVGNPLLIGQLVGDAVLITRLVKADPGIPCAANSLGLRWYQE